MRGVLQKLELGIVHSYSTFASLLSSRLGGPADHANNYPFRGAKGSE